jgi:hypothetical protein
MLDVDGGVGRLARRAAGHCVTDAEDLSTEGRHAHGFCASARALSMPQPKMGSWDDMVMDSEMSRQSMAAEQIRTGHQAHVGAPTCRLSRGPLREVLGAWA